MVIFRKKRIIFFISCLIVSFIGLRFEANLENDTVLTSSTPVSGYTIFLDAGHGNPDRSEQFLMMVFLKKKLI